jgi:hypothetical protein
MNERTRILGMLRDGKLSVEEADRLLRALGADRDRPDAARGRTLRVRISSHRGERVNVAVPLALAEMVLRFLPKNLHFVTQGQEVDIADLVRGIGGSDAVGTIVDVRDPRGDHIEVIVE